MKQNFGICYSLILMGCRWCGSPYSAPSPVLCRRTQKEEGSLTLSVPIRSPSTLDFYSEEGGRRNGVTMGLAPVGGVCLPAHACVVSEFGTTDTLGRPYPSAGFTSTASSCLHHGEPTGRRPGHHAALGSWQTLKVGGGNWCDGGACVSSDPSFQQSTDGPIGDVTTWSEWKSSECRSGCTQRGRGARERRRTCPATAKCEGSAYDVALCDDVKVCGKKTRVTANELAARKCTEYAALECGWAVPYSAAAQPAVASTRHESSSMTLVWSPTSRTARGATSTVLPTTTACSIIAYLRISR
ncbi:unnamed protein product [Leptidea sinapis]|uniref:ADAMTS cysteine-rich domain-containing protein n=1 Tax=Leptidea sinapis TaxID=189913 RepID=A0A5E4PYS4_9NEOP|nr:unnamed protein product [Leptidea sinapis]